MKKRLKDKSDPVPQQVETDIADLISKMHQQLVLLDKKVDTLISRPTERPPETRPPYKPFQRFDPPHRHGEGRQPDAYRERNLHKAICADCKKECEVPFKPSQDRPVYCKECFSKRKATSAYNAHTDSRPRVVAPVHERAFHKSHGGENRVPYEKKRIYTKRKKRS